MADHIQVSNEELRSVRDTGRELGRLIESLERGDLEKVVITRHGKMVAVLRPLQGDPRG